MAHSENQRSVQAVLESCQKLWDAYLELGPGRVEPPYLVAVENAVQQFESSQDGAEAMDLVEAVEVLLKLSRQCVNTSHGLSFVTGEAGLVPRKDLHQRFEDCLARLANQV